MKPRIRKILTNKIKRYLTSAIGSYEALELMVDIEPIINSVTDKDGYEWINANEITKREISKFRDWWYFDKCNTSDPNLVDVENWLEKEGD